MKTLLAVLVYINLISIAPSFAALGNSSGGGGDASEVRVNDIRSDIFKWVNNGGAAGLKLPSDISIGEYESQMKNILQPQKVVIGFIEKDDEKNDELKVRVNGVPKTCRGFISKIDSKPHIICNISRFGNTSPTEQYKLIHHEFAGLVNLENNDDAASDYSVSSQITEYLELNAVLKLGIKKRTYDKDMLSITRVPSGSIIKLALDNIVPSGVDSIFLGRVENKNVLSCDLVIIPDIADRHLVGNLEIRIENISRYTNYTLQGMTFSHTRPNINGEVYFASAGELDTHSSITLNGVKRDNIELHCSSNDSNNETTIGMLRSLVENAGGSLIFSTPKPF
jgi:hypothetical protein